MKKIYLAAPLFNPRELAWNEEICKELERHNWEVFLPQRDGGKSAELMAQAITPDEVESARAGIFEADLEAVKNCDVLVFISDGVVMDPGACAEVGIAFILGKFIVMLHQDVRSFIQGRVNLFVEGCIDETVGTVNDLLEFLARSE